MQCGDMSAHFKKFQTATMFTSFFGRTMTFLIVLPAMEPMMNFG